MTEVISPFSQFNIPQISTYKQNAVVQNDTLPKEDAAQSNKKQFNSKSSLIPLGATTAGALSGFMAAQLNKHKNNKIAKIQIEEHKAALLQKFNENSDVKAINDKLQGANTLLKTTKECGINYIKKRLSDEKSPKKITDLKEKLKSAQESEKFQEAILEKLNTDLKTKFTELVEKPLKKFIDNLMDKTAQHNKVFTKKAVILSILIGLAIGVLIPYTKNRQKEEKNEGINTKF